MSKKVLVVLAEGFEDMEAVAPIDILNRAGVEVTIASLVKGPTKGAYGTTIVPHKSIDEIDLDFIYDGIVFPGGRVNAQALSKHPKVMMLVHRHHSAHKMVSAICAAPSHVLGEGAKILKGKRSSGDPTFNDMLAASGAIVSGEIVTVDDNIITGMGPGAAIPFALQLVEYLVDKQTADQYAEKWLISR
ncbi:MAG: DJ-1 family glyoxalase III [candidate division Zixibacteria bacterium]|nr:DJ-1 family glyoxalase III [candidate division Zixibacteria bacterium]